jgi:hypothetical protein
MSTAEVRERKEREREPSEVEGSLTTATPKAAPERKSKDPDGKAGKDTHTPKFKYENRWPTDDSVGETEVSRTAGDGAKGGKTAVGAKVRGEGASNPPNPNLPFRMILNSPSAARRTLARVIRAMASGTIDGRLGGKISYSISILLNAFGIEQDTTLLARMEAIERLARGEGQGGGDEAKGT